MWLTFSKCCKAAGLGQMKALRHKESIVFLEAHRHRAINNEYITPLAVILKTEHEDNYMYRLTSRGTEALEV